MIDIFLQEDAKGLLKNKNVVFMGDSNMRALYKDALCLLSYNKLISEKFLKKKGEASCYGDTLFYIGEKYNGREYREERNGSCGDTKLFFYFLTRVYDTYVKKIVKDLTKDPKNLPDVLIVNSCLWDVTRWGPNGVELYKKNLVLLMQDLKERMPDCLVIWVTAPPIACDPSGGFLVKEIEFLKYTIRFHVVEANHYARQVVVQKGFDVVDSHYHLKLQIHRRTPDGIHWFPEAVRYVTNLLLTHISIAWNVPLPHRFKSEKLEENPVLLSDEEEEPIEPIKVSAVKVLENCTDGKQKENKKKKAVAFPTPQKSKKLKRSLRKRNIFQESHHSYLKRMDCRERHNRIRQWEKPDENLPSNTPFGTHYSLYSNEGDFRYHSNSNPEPDNTYDQQRFINSPRHIPLPPGSYIRPKKTLLSSPSNHTYINYQQRFINSPRHIPLPPSPYQRPDNAFVNSALSGYRNVVMHTPLQMYNMSPARNIHVSQYRNFANEPCQSLYWSGFQNDNPLPTNNQFQLQPNIDFASTDNIPFGFQF